jgi:hypothetical protein
MFNLVEIFFSFQPQCICIEFGWRGQDAIDRHFVNTFFERRDFHAPRRDFHALLLRCEKQLCVFIAFLKRLKLASALLLILVSELMVLANQVLIVRRLFPEKTKKQ